MNNRSINRVVRFSFYVDIKGDGTKATKSGIVDLNIHNETKPDYVAITGKAIGETELTVKVKADGNEILKTYIVKVVDPADIPPIDTITLKVGDKHKLYPTDIANSSTDIKEDSTTSSNSSVASVETFNEFGIDYVVVTARSAGETQLTVTVELKGTSGQQTKGRFTIKVVEPEGGVPREDTPFEDILDNIDSYSRPDDLDEGTASKIENATSVVLSAITSIGIVVAILILAVLGIKYMLGSVEEKAEYKKDLVPYLIGAVLLFGILTFVKIFMQWGETISNI